MDGFLLCFLLFCVCVCVYALESENKLENEEIERGFGVFLFYCMVWTYGVVFGVGDFLFTYKNNNTYVFCFCDGKR